MVEVEIKSSLGNITAEKLQEIAAVNGFVESDTLNMTDVYYNGIDRNFAETDEALRLRSVINAATSETKTFITYKGPKTDLRSNTRKECETQIGDLSVMADLLGSLGYTKVFAVEKCRKEMLLTAENITLCIDDVKNLGTFMELEILVEDEAKKQQSIDRLLSMLDTFGIPQENLTRKSYLEMLLAQQ